VRISLLFLLLFALSGILFLLRFRDLFLYLLDVGLIVFYDLVLLVLCGLFLQLFWVGLVVLADSYLREVCINVERARVVNRIIRRTVSWILLLWRLRLLFLLVTVIRVLIGIVLILDDAQAARSHQLAVFASQKAELLLEVVL